MTTLPLIWIDEKYASRSVQRETDNTITETRVIIIHGVEEENDALRYLDEYVSEVLQVDGKEIKLISSEIEQEEQEIWKASVKYKTPASIVINDTNDRTFSFSINASTQHITHSKKTTGKYSNGEEIPDFKNAIGITPDNEIVGCDILLPEFQFQDQQEISAGSVNMALIKKWAQLVGKVNSSSFFEFSPGEVLFMGCEGSRKNGEAYNVTFHYSVSTNANNLTIGDISGIEKKGWDYLWVYSQTAKDETEKFIVKRPRYVFTEQVYDTGDFSILTGSSRPQQVYSSVNAGLFNVGTQ